VTLCYRSRRGPLCKSVTKLRTSVRPSRPCRTAPVIRRWERDWSALCSRLLGGARLCSLLLESDLGLSDEPQVGGVVVAILTSEKSLVRTQVCPPLFSNIRPIFGGSSLVLRPGATRVSEGE
jgi:hypothetical protein